MEKNVSYFVLKTTKSIYEYRNLPLYKIREDLKKTLPKLTDETIDHFFANPKNFIEPIAPKVAPKKRGGYKCCIETLPTTNNKFVKEYKELFKLANSLYAYHKNGYRQWGNIVNEIFDDGCIQPYFAEFDKAFENVYSALNNNDDTATIESIAVLYDTMLKFRSVMKGHNTLKEYSGMEFVNGNNRRLGMQVIIDRIPNIEMKKVA